MADVYVRLPRPEGYEDVHPTLLIEDAIPNPVWEAEDVTTEFARLRALLREVRGSGMEFDAPGVGYVTVQIDRPTWDAIKAALEGR